MRPGVCQGRRVEQTSDLLFQVRTSAPVAVRENPFALSTGKGRENWSAAPPIWRIERPVLVVSMRRQPDDQSISRQRSPQISSRRAPVKAINRRAAVAAGCNGSCARSTAPSAAISPGDKVRSFASPRCFSTPRTGLGPLTSPRFSAHDQTPPSNSTVRAAATPPPPGQSGEEVRDKPVER